MGLGKEEIRNRFGYHPGTDKTIPMHEKLREAYIAFAEFLDAHLGACDQEFVKQAFLSLHQSAMWANFAIALLSPVEEQQKYNITNFDDLSDVARGEPAANNIFE